MVCSINLESDLKFGILKYFPALLKFSLSSDNDEDRIIIFFFLNFFFMSRIIFFCSLKNLILKKI